MSFTELLQPYSVAVIVSALGCPRQTAYAWKDGSRQPPQWQQELFMAAIARSPKSVEIKRHNKTPHGTPRKSVGKSES